ncbi:MAG: substrate-binding domain-containing protein [Kiritimatiellae bacterium]|nr:substrate-binding domain-containing protein [Kiritimatiellia bacterium]
MRSTPPKVVIAIPTNGNDGREMMSGVFDYLNSHPLWEIHLINTRTDIANGALERMARDADGIFLSIAYENKRLARHFLSSDVKMVVSEDHLVPLYAGRANCGTILLDSVSIGQDAARYFNSLGRFASYGFVHGHTHFPWSDERERGFRDAKPKDVPLYVYPQDADASSDELTSAIDNDSLAEWLTALPKPAAVFGANDLFARDVLAVCNRLGLKVPQQVSVVGCDNDPLICSGTKEQLTSFQLPFHELGYRGAEMLARLLQGRKPPCETVRVGGTRLFERGSSAPIPPAKMLVDRALNYIAAAACGGLRAADVATHLGVSRSLLDLRFRQICGKSVLQEITDRRLDEVKRLLAETGLPIIRIGQQAGFNDPDNLKRLFRRRFGVTMRDWRAQAGNRPQ